MSFWSILFCLQACSLDGAGQVEVQSVTDLPAATYPDHDGDFWAAIGDLSLREAASLAESGGHRQFVAAMDSAVRGNWDGVASTLDCTGNALDDIRQKAARLELRNLVLQTQSKWQALRDLVRSHPGLLPESRHEILVTSVAYASSPPERFEVTRQPVTIAMDPILTGQPEIEVKVNGRAFPFILDTGAGITVLTEEAAEACGVDPIGSDVGYARTSTSHRVAFRPGVVKQLSIGGVVIENHPVAIVKPDDLSFGIVGITLVRIRGIVGWPVFSKMAVTLDYDRSEATFVRSEGGQVEDPNLFWLGYPIVRILSEEGIPLHFGLDTGAQKSSLKDRTLSKLDVSFVTADDFAMGAGGSEHVRVREAKDLSLYLSGCRMTRLRK